MHARIRKHSFSFCSRGTTKFCYSSNYNTHTHMPRSKSPRRTSRRSPRKSRRSKRRTKRSPPSVFRGNGDPLHLSAVRHGQNVWVWNEENEEWLPGVVDEKSSANVRVALPNDKKVNLGHNLNGRLLKRSQPWFHKSSPPDKEWEEPNLSPSLEMQININDLFKRDLKVWMKERSDLQSRLNKVEAEATQLAMRIVTEILRLVPTPKASNEEIKFELPVDDVEVTGTLNTHSYSHMHGDYLVNPHFATTNGISYSKLSGADFKKFVTSRVHKKLGHEIAANNGQFDDMKNVLENYVKKQPEWKKLHELKKNESPTPERVVFNDKILQHIQLEGNYNPARTQETPLDHGSAASLDLPSFDEMMQSLLALALADVHPKEKRLAAVTSVR